MFSRCKAVLCSQIFYGFYPSINFMNLHLLFINNLFHFSGIKSILSIFVTIPFRIMGDTVSNNVETLVRRLNEAERRAKLLNLEVKSIRQEIATLQQSVQARSAHGDAVTERYVVNASLPSGSSVDGPISNKRYNENESQQPQKRIKGPFTYDSEYVVVYTDGACENNGKRNAKAGIGVWFGEMNPLNISKPVEGRATNNHAEIQACIEALVVIKDYGEKKVKIFTDSEFTINCMTKWIKNWKKNQWRTSKGEPVKNKEELQELDKIITYFEHVSWVHVAGHNGIKGNEGADQLARQGALRYKPPN